MKTRFDTFPAPFLTRLYSMPRPYYDDAGWYRFHHLDLAEMDTSDLRWEGRRVQLRLDYEADIRNRIWLEERVEQVREHLAKLARTQERGRRNAP